MTIKELTSDNRALTIEVEVLREIIDQLKAKIEFALSKEVEALEDEIQLKAEIKRLDALLNPKPEGK